MGRFKRIASSVGVTILGAFIAVLLAHNVAPWLVWPVAAITWCVAMWIAVWKEALSRDSS